MERPFYIYNGISTSYSQFAHSVNRRTLDCRPWRGSIIALWADHNPSFIIDLFAIWNAGAIPLLLSRRLPWNTVESLLDLAGAASLITPDDVPSCRIPVLSQARGDNSGNVGSSDTIPEIGCAEQELALILHSSGTTATPKLVQIKRSSLLASINFLLSKWANIWTEQDGSLGSLPLYHTFGLVSELLCTYSIKGNNLLDKIAYSR